MKPGTIKMAILQQIMNLNMTIRIILSNKEKKTLNII